MSLKTSTGMTALLLSEVHMSSQVLCSRLCEPSFFLITGKEQGLHIMRAAQCSGGLESRITTAVWIGVPTDFLAYFGHNCAGAAEQGCAENYSPWLYISHSRGICYNGSGQKRNQRIMVRPSSRRVGQGREGWKGLRCRLGQ